MIGRLPSRVIVNGTEYDIRTDFRDVLNVLCAFNDPDLQDAEKVYVCLNTLYPDFEDLPTDDYRAAYDEAVRFINMGRDSTKEGKSPQTVDWEQDEALIFSAINKVAGMETRAQEHIHWWTFMGWFMEISDGVYSNVLSLRSKKARGKKLEKWEREFWSANKDICQLKVRLSEEEKAAKEKLEAMLG